MPTWLIWTLGLGVPLAAAAVPIIIHLINLTRYRRIEWAAMEFLLNAYRRTRRRMQMESLIMLLLRVLAVILLACALFPMGCQRIKEWAQDAVGMSRLTLSTDAPLHLVIILDDSASMAYAQEGQSAFERGRQYALSLVESLKPGRDRVSIIRLSDVYVPPRAGGQKATDEEAGQSTRRRVGQLASLDLDAARDAIGATTIAAVDSNVLGAIREAARAIEGTPDQDAAGLVVISDFVESGWKELRKDGSVHKDFREVMERLNERLKKSGTPPTFFDAGFETTQNVAITGLQCAERIVGNGMEASVMVDVAFYATGAAEEGRSVHLKYRIDGGSERPIPTVVNLKSGQPLEQIELKLAARELALKPDEEKAGASRNIEVFTDDPDLFKADNSRSLVVHVVPDIPILVVNGVWHKSPDLDETFYLETALGISSSKVEGESRDEKETRITPNRIVSVRPEALTSVESFLDYRLVVLCNVRELAEATVTRLEEFVAAGYSLLIFDGDQVQPQTWNDAMYKKGQGLLPAKLREEGGSRDPGVDGFSLVPDARDHPVLIMFETPEDIEIVTSPAVIRNWRRVEIPQGAEADPLRPVEVVMSVNAKDGPSPFMLERPYGRGKVVYVTTSAGSRWNSLWTSNGLPLFLYLELAHYLTGSEARYSNLAVGEPWRRALRQRDIAPRFTVRDPAATETEVQPTAEQGLKLLEYGGTAAPGVYTVTALERTESGQPRRKWQERFAVNLEPRESNVRRLAGDEKPDPETAVREALGEMDIQFIRAGTELGEGALAGSDSGGGLWMWLAILGVTFLLCETVWSAVITKPED